MLWTMLTHTVQASLSGALPPNCAITGYAIGGELLTSVHLSTEIFPNKSDIVSVLCKFLKILVLQVVLWKELGVEART